MLYNLANTETPLFSCKNSIADIKNASHCCVKIVFFHLPCFFVFSYHSLLNYSKTSSFLLSDEIKKFVWILKHLLWPFLSILCMRIETNILFYCFFWFHCLYVLTFTFYILNARHSRKIQTAYPIYSAFNFALFLNASFEHSVAICQCTRQKFW